ncbi:hypothetical protein T02_11203 [Trichinella nativa]|uniref:Uncharacterized protein n=1 Tax=Trichinella nativa TaxID=6335 RepID=A0A0V1LS67_9BILA|nr:hypothetical protein T02_11203 [Trichinella nativa]
MDYARFHHNYVPYVVIDGWSRHILNSVVTAYGKEVSTKSKIFDAVVKARTRNLVSFISQVECNAINVHYHYQVSMIISMWRTDFRDPMANNKHETHNKICKESKKQIIVEKFKF